MKRKIICAALFILMIACCLCAAACAKQPVTLEAPSNIEVWGREITWDKVDGAQSYIVFFNGKESEVTKCTYTLPKSAHLGEHTVEILSVGNGKTTLDSEWTQQSFTLYEAVSHGYDEQGFEYNLLEDGSGYEISKGRISRETYVHLELPDKYLGYPVKSIGRWGFTVPGWDIVNRDIQTGAYCNALTKSVKFPSRLERIDDCAFAYAIYLTEAVFPDTLTEIGSSAFLDCVRLSRVQFNEGLKIIENQVFSDCAIEELVLPQSLEVIGNVAFKSFDTIDEAKYNKNNFGAQKFTSVVIPENVKEIGNEAFALCTNLENITILSKHLDSIGSNIMGGKVNGAGLETAWYESQPNGWVYLREDILYGYKGEWADGGVCEVPSVKYIAGGAFEKSNFTEIILPDGLETISIDLLRSSKNLVHVTIPESVTAINYDAFWGCSGLQEIVIPAGVTKIGSSAFRGCTRLTAITVPEGISTIEKGTFSRCENLTEITLPQSIRNIDMGAFNSCTNLHTINYAGTKQQWKNIEKNERWFINGEFTVYCTDGKLDQDGAIVP